MINWWSEFLRFMDERCETCGCMLNNAPECDPNLNDGNGCAHTQRIQCVSRIRVFPETGEVRAYRNDDDQA